LSRTAPVEAVRSALEARGRKARGRDHDFMACCPAHDDRDPSLHVSEGKDGRALVHCHAGCSTADVLAALGLGMTDLYREPWHGRVGRVSHSRPALRDRLVFTLPGGRVFPGRHDEPGRDEFGIIDVDGVIRKWRDGQEVPHHLDDLARKVLRLIHDHAFNAPVSCPSMDLLRAELAEQGTEVSKSSVRWAIKRLEAEGCIAVTQLPSRRYRGFVFNQYTILTRWVRPLRWRMMRLLNAAKSRLLAPDDTGREPPGREKEKRGAGGGSNRRRGPVCSGDEAELAWDSGVAFDLAPRRSECDAEDRPELLRRELFDGFVAEHVAEDLADGASEFRNRGVAHSLECARSTPRMEDVQ
jgi:hypothetical protein